VELKDEMLGSGDEQVVSERENPSLRILQEELDLLEDWERILVLMRSHDVAYSEIARYVDKPEKHLRIYYARIRRRLIDRVKHTITQGSHEKS
jgi:DNA-directed RNA polymerase specialized sigma24 family protein